MDITQYMTEELVALDVDLQTGPEVIVYLAEMAERTGVVSNAGELEQALLEREKLGSTGVGHGLAIPHVHVETQQIAAAFLRTAAGIDYGAIDGNPSQLFFLVISSKADKKGYLNVLASIATKAKHKDVLEALMNASSPQEVLNIFRG